MHIFLSCLSPFALEASDFMSSTMTHPSDADVVVLEAIVTDHPAHEDMLENLRIDRVGRTALHQMPHYPMAIVVLLGLLLALAALSISLG